MYSKHCQTSNGFQPLIIFAKSWIVDVRLNSEYASVLHVFINTKPVEGKKIKHYGSNILPEATFEKPILQERSIKDIKAES